MTYDGSSPGNRPSHYTPRKGRIYAMCSGAGGLCFWAEGHFEHVTQEERQEFFAKGGRTLTEEDFDLGWSKHTFGVPGFLPSFSTFSVPVGTSNLSVITRTWPTKSGSIAIRLRREGKDPEVVWEQVTRWGIVSRSEYEGVFHKAH
jgi:hypothetical protein